MMGPAAPERKPSPNAGPALCRCKQVAHFVRRSARLDACPWKKKWFRSIILIDRWSAHHTISAVLVWAKV